MNRFKVGEDLPALCDYRDLMRVFGVGASTIFSWDKAGKLRRFETRRPLGAKRWSGKLLQEHINGRGASLALTKAS